MRTIDAIRERPGASSEAGFTLMDLVAVIAGFGAMTGVLVPPVQTWREEKAAGLSAFQKTTPEGAAQVTASGNDAPEGEAEWRSRHSGMTFTMMDGSVRLVSGRVQVVDVKKGPSLQLASAQGTHISVPPGPLQRALTRAHREGTPLNAVLQGRDAHGIHVARTLDKVIVRSVRRSTSDPQALVFFLGGVPADTPTPRRESGAPAP